MGEKERRLEIRMATQPGDRLQALSDDDRFSGSTMETQAAKMKLRDL